VVEDGKYVAISGLALKASLKKAGSLPGDTSHPGFVVLIMAAKSEQLEGRRDRMSDWWHSAERKVESCSGKKCAD